MGGCPEKVGEPIFWQVIRDRLTGPPPSLQIRREIVNPEVLCTHRRQSAGTVAVDVVSGGAEAFENSFREVVAVAVTDIPRGLDPRFADEF